MGLEQSHQQPSSFLNPSSSSLVSKSSDRSAAPSNANTNARPGVSTSPRPSISSDSDIPYISYTINRPIGESPKLKPKHGHHSLRSKSPSPNVSPKPQRPRSMTGHDIVVVKEAVPREETAESDPDLCRLQNIPAFLPIMRGALNVPMMRDPEVLDKLDYQQLFALCSRYEQHLRICAEGVVAEQNNLASRIREIDFAISTLVNILTERQKKYVRYAEKLGKVHEISTTIDKCQSSLKDAIEKMESLNALLSPEEQLEPFVWTTG